MRKLFLSAICIIAAVVTVQAQLTLGAQLGVSMPHMRYKWQNTNLKDKGSPGPAVGAVAGLQLADHFYIQSGIFYIGTNGQSPFSYVQKMHMHTLEVPVTIEYKFGHKGGNHMGVGLGIYGAVNVGGKISWQSYYDYATIVPAGSRLLRIGSDPTYGNHQGDDIKTLDFGVGANAFYELKNGLFFQARYQRGMANLLPGGSAPYAMKTQVYILSAGFYFNDRVMKKLRKPSSVSHKKKMQKKEWDIDKYSE